MPSKSIKQAHFMRAAAAKPSMARKLGVPASVAKEFVAADHGKKQTKLPEYVKPKKV